MKKIAVITSGFLPVPDVLGGAVEALEMNYIVENEKYKNIFFTFFSIWDERAERQARSYSGTHFDYVRPSGIVRTIDKLIYEVISHLRRNSATTRHRYMVQRLYYIVSVAWRLRSGMFDSILIEDNPLLFWCLRLFGNEERYQGRVYYHLHRDFERDFGCSRVISQVRRVIGVSKFVIDSLDAYIAGHVGRSLDSDQKAVLFNCTDVSSFNPANKGIAERALLMRQELGISRDGFVVLYSGRLTQEKGVEELVRAFVNANIHNATLVLTGAHFYNLRIKSPFEERLSELITSSEASIKLTGYVEHKDMPALYAMADVCCAPSLCEDAAPLAVVEALASGCPVIATRSGGIPEYVDGECAVLLDRDENLVRNLEISLKMLSKDSETANKMAHHAREVGGTRTPDRFYKELVSFLDSKISDGGMEETYD